MDKLLFTAMSGASRVMMAQQVHANNLANVNTTGFRADIEQAKSIAVKGEGYNSRTLVAARSGGTDFSSGALQNTDNPFDIAIRGEGFFLRCRPEKMMRPIPEPVTFILIRMAG